MTPVYRRMADVTDPCLLSSGTILLSKTCEACKEGERLAHERDEALRGARSRGFLASVLTTTGALSL